MLRRFVKVAVVVVALVLAGMMALSAFKIELPISSSTTTTVGDFTITTKCTWLHSPFDGSTGCTTTRTRTRSK
jgi:putative copper export protein